MIIFSIKFLKIMKISKSFISIFAFGTLVSCAANSLSYEGRTFRNSYQSITAQDLKEDLYIISSDDMKGRNTGEEGQKKAAAYLVEQYKKMGINPPKGMNDYFQKIPSASLKSWRGNLADSENVLAYIEGTEKPDEVIVISAHYDHIGYKNDEVFNGADDNGSGTVALLELAEAFQKAKNKGKAPKRSILFLHVTGEEHGLLGSKYYAENPVFPLKNTVANINMDMVGRSDAENKGKNYVYVIGSDMLSSELKQITEAANAKTHQLILNYKYDDPKDPMRLYYRSDHYNFAKNGIPSVFFFDGLHEDYHKTTDDADKIEYDLLTKRTQLVFATAWELANREKRIVVDKK